MSETAILPLDDLGVLSFHGPDARKFLQGQLSNDVTALAPGVLMRAGLHNPQGRALALLALIASQSGELLAVLPRELIATTSSTLRRYVLRAKVTIEDQSANHRLYGIVGARGDAGDAGPREEAGPRREAGAVGRAGMDVAYDAQRRLRVLAPNDAPPCAPELPRTQWRLLDIAAGLPQVYGPTSGQFVAQMLNLDCIGAISFAKGCYTGQEVIARAHYRGRVKRRMQRFVSSAPLQLAPGDTGQLADGRGFRVVEAAARADGSVEFLAVTALPGTGPGAAGAEPDAVAGPAVAPVQAQALPLPYPLPE